MGSKTDFLIVMITQVDDANDFDSSDYSLSIISIVCCLEKSEWILDTGATYHVYPKREWIANFEKLDGGLVHSMMDTHVILRDMCSLHQVI